MCVYRENFLISKSLLNDNDDLVKPINVYPCGFVICTQRHVSVLTTTRRSYSQAFVSVSVRIIGITV